MVQIFTAALADNHRGRKKVDEWLIQKSSIESVRHLFQGSRGTFTRVASADALKSFANDLLDVDASSSPDRRRERSLKNMNAVGKTLSESRRRQTLVFLFILLDGRRTCVVWLILLSGFRGY